MSAAVQLENVYCSEKGENLLSAVNLTVHAGDAVFVAGDRGSGVGSLLRAVAGKLVPTRGEATLLGAPCGRSALGKQKIASFLSTQAGGGLMGIISARRDDGIPADPQRTVLEMLEKHAAEYRGIDSEQIEQAALMLGVWGVRDERYGALGECLQALACLACVFETNPRLIVLENPFEKLDISSARLLKDAIKLYTKKKGAACVLSAGALADPSDFCERAVVMRGPRLISDFALNEPLNERRRYLYFIGAAKPHIASAVASEIGFTSTASDSGIRCALTPRELSSLLAELCAAGVEIREARALTGGFEDAYFDALDFMGGNLI